MKKFFVSAVVIIGFIAYSLYQKAAGVTSSQAIAQNKLSSSSSSVSPTSSPTPKPSNTPVPTPTPTSVPSTNKSGSITPAPTDTPMPTSTPIPTPTPTSGYKDGTFTGDPEDAFYGIIQVRATISGGRLTNVKFLQYPNDQGTSIFINEQADPMLAQEAIQMQGANVDIVSGATDSSQAFIQSLQTALDKAKN